MCQIIHASRHHGGALVAAIGVLAATGHAFADDTPDDTAQLDRSSIAVVPPECRRYLTIPDELRDSIIEWEQALSFAACLQGGPVSTVGHAVQLASLVDELTHRLEIPMWIYADALAFGPPPIQLRAAFHIGMSQLALSTRARSAIAAPPAGDAAAAARARALHERLEPLLAHARRGAWLSFTAIGEAAAQNPALASDVVARNMIRTARVLLEGLRDAGRDPLAVPGEEE